ncbi:MAG TPA: P-II family nitrogen regulator [Streptosporangiaceae bacterium]|nr:P-II family nitrogen regulator [Streptosporangiaceae bacterium]
MKLVTAIVRPEKLDDLVDELVGNGAPGLTVTEIRGFGRQYGQLAASRAAAGGAPAGIKGEPAAVLLGKIRLDILVLDEDAESMVEVIEKSARTGTIGDGKVWVTPVESALRVRTGERGRDAV